ncbi:MAG: type I-C CRISPR-associated protein Cas7/Csd2 [Kiritimatiellae bacterium]|nr:type I-C CRISPR-associated protein Cas7/Csd2 [Kiritimatiellia bacterium]
MSTLTNRHDILLLFEVTNGNPNGDPDAGNMPRRDPNTGLGFVTDVCLKRKIRNFVELYPPERRSNPDANGYNILIKQGAVIETEQKKGEDAAKAAVKAGALPAGKSGEEKLAEYAIKWLCREFYDLRTFGGVLSTGNGVLNGSAFGQVRGPVQFTFAQSVDPIEPLGVTITRCAVTAEKDKGKERTMGDKYIVPYALYVAKAYVSPAFAKKTGFTDEDLELFFKALEWMFAPDSSAARAEMTVRGIYDFEHVGTHADSTDEVQKRQNEKEASLGCAHAHKLFDGIKVALKPGAEHPASFADYEIDNTWSTRELPKGVVLHIRGE